MDTERDVAALLREQPVMGGPLPSFDPDAVPGEPAELFLRWLARAVDEGVPEPHTVTLSTADARGRPSSRVLLLRDVDVARAGWLFASSTTSRKGRELAENPWAAMCAYWPSQGRQVRVAGRVEVCSAVASARAFLARSPAARLAALTGRQSAPLQGSEEYAEAEREAAALLAEHPETVPVDFALYVLWAEEVEFWQGDEDRHHVRLRYLHGATGWERQRLWP